MHCKLVRAQNENCLHLIDTDGNIVERVHDMVLYEMMMEKMAFTRENYWNVWLNGDWDDGNPDGIPWSPELVEETMEQFQLALPFLKNRSVVQ